MCETSEFVEYEHSVAYIYIAQPVSKRRAPCGIHYDSNVLLFCEENYAILHFP